MNETQKPLVLIVDDTSDNISLLASILGTDYEIAIATNGTQALEMVGDTPPNLILLDVMMPDIDGYEVCRRLKKNMATHMIPVIFLTAKSEVDDIVRGFDAGGVDYVTKPFQTAELKARVKTHIQFQQLKSLLAICAYCNKIRDGEDWKKVDVYIREKTGTDFSHGICPSCYEKVVMELKKQETI
ncbi:MAG: response regulator [Candidatus Riflebacteria bacterium]|nr:response regulator [Candidatus Riflebacteria bacterium]